MQGRWWPAYVGIGSNLSEPRMQVLAAAAALATLPSTRCVAVSALYATAPMGDVRQPDFVNAVAGLLTQLAPRALLDALLDLERRRGRVRDGTRWGPRTIDLDLLIFGTARVDEPSLRLPHPGVGSRVFVLRPLADLAPDLEVPGVGRVSELLRRGGFPALTALPGAT